MKIVEFEPQMAEQIALIEKECFSEPWSAESILESYNFNTAFFAAIGDGGVLEGYIGVQNIAGEAFITDLAVKKEYRRRGVGNALLQRAMEYCRASKLGKISLEVRKSNNAAVKLYSAVGFKTVGERKNFYSFPREDALIMAAEIQSD